MNIAPDRTAKADMMIRKPISEVFEAFIDPAITCKFWFTHGSGKLVEGQAIEWSWEMYGLTIPVSVKTIQPNERILIEWGSGKNRSAVEWSFKALSPSKTYLSIRNYGFLGTEEEVIAKTVDSVGGFTMVTAGLKAWLEHGIQLQLIGDKFPEEMRGE